MKNTKKKLKRKSVAVAQSLEHFKKIGRAHFRQLASTEKKKQLVEKVQKYR